MNCVKSKAGELGLVVGSLLTLFALGFALQNAHPLAQDVAYHHFVDTRAWGGVPNAGDVLSNAGLMVVSLTGLGWLSRGRNLQALTVPAWTFFLGLLATAVGSAYYHLAPSNATLVWDRLPMAWTFAGALSAVCLCVSRKALGYLSQALIWVGACATVVLWAETGVLWPYVLLQFGGLALIAGLCTRKQLLGRQGWYALLGWYGVAKLLEHFDAGIWALTSHLVSGHTLKHLASAAAGLAFLRLLKAVRFSASS